MGDRIMAAMGEVANTSAGRTPRKLPAPPWARVQRVQLVRREVREYLPPTAVQLLLARAECVVEGGDELGPAAGPPGRRVYATVMATIDLEGGAGLFREPADEATAQRVAELLESTPGVARRLVELARPELSRLAGAPAASLEISLEHHARAEGSRILIDGDAMAVAPKDAASTAN
ncbi:MAG: hypothetical protein AAF721_27755 [Myxococcota bacterium]